MSLLILIALSTPLLLSPFYTHLLFQDLYEREREQIAIDNSAIELGKGEKKFFNMVASFNQWLLALEKVHHPIHLCAKTPSPAAAACKVFDHSLEVSLKVILSQMTAVLKTSWQALIPLTKQKALLLQKQVCRIDHSTLFPIEQKKCPICERYTAWQLNSSFSPYHLLEICSPWPHRARVSMEIKGTSTLTTKDWDYELTP